MTGLLPLIHQFTYSLYCFIAIGVGADGLKAFDDFLFLLKVGMLGLANTRSGFFSVVEEIVAGFKEAVPDGIAVLLVDRAY